MNPIFTTFTPLTPEERAAQNAEYRAAAKTRALASLAVGLARDAAATLKAIDKANRDGLSKIWASPFFTPEEAFAALGNKAVTFVAGSASTTAFLTAQYELAGGVPQPDGTVAPYVPPALPAGVELTLNPDGTVTVVLA